MVNKPIRIGVMGCANIAKRSVIPAILKLSRNFQLVAVASRAAEKAEEFAKAFGCEAIVGYDKLVRRRDIDALYMPLPTGLHRQWVNEALGSGKHVYVEKSIANSVSDAKEMVSNARVRKLALMEGYMFLYHGQHRIVHDLISSGAIGEIRHFFGSFGFPPLPRSNFRYDMALGGGALLDAAGYPLRAAHDVLGRGLEVKAGTLYFDPETKSNEWGSAFLSTGNGIGASIAFGFDNYYQCRYEVWGSKGKIVAERAYTPGPGFRPIVRLEGDSGIQEIEAPAEDHFIGALTEFHRMILAPDACERHYDDVVVQSRSLDLIRSLGAPEL